MSPKYEAFLNNKLQVEPMGGFEPLWLPDWMIDFQRDLTDFTIRKGRAATLADCGLGKGPMQLVWSENAVRKTGRPALIVAPLAVSHQFVREGEKFNIECLRSSDGKPAGRITITNYEQLHKFNPDDYASLSCDESSILKNYDGATKRIVTEFMRKMQYRHLATATAAPNDFVELGTSSEALGYLGHMDMITRFFKECEGNVVKRWKTDGKYGNKYRFRGHAEEQFWRWVCSWARVIRKPSDLGYSDGRFTLPPLIEREHVVANSKPRDGMLFSTPATGLEEQREERRITMTERCEAVAKMAAEDDTCVVWCHLNPEGKMLAKIIPDAVEVSGTMSDDEKEEKLIAFQDGKIKRLVTKPKIGCFGLNWQHCHKVYTFPSHSWEAYYQCVRRCYRFGQTQPVTVTTVTTEGEIDVLKNLQRKSAQADVMFAKLTQYVNNALHIQRGAGYPDKEKMPSWLQTKN